MGVRSYQYRAGRCGLLHTRGDIWRLAEYINLLAGINAHHHCARIDADPNGEHGMRRYFVELLYRGDDRQAGARNALGVIVVSLGISEESHYTVAEILRDVATEAGYRFGGGALVSGHSLEPFLGIELRGDRC